MKAMKIFLYFNLLYFWKIVLPAKLFEGNKFLCEPLNRDAALFLIKNFHKIPIFDAKFNADLFIQRPISQTFQQFIAEMLTTHINCFLMTEENNENSVHLRNSIEFVLIPFLSKAKNKCEQLQKISTKKYRRKIWEKIGKTFKKGEKEKQNIQTILTDNAQHFVQCIYHILYGVLNELIKNIGNDQQNQKQFDRNDEFSTIKQIYLNLYENSLKILKKNFKMNSNAEKYLNDHLNVCTKEENLPMETPIDTISKLSDQIDQHSHSIKSNEVARSYNKVTNFVKQSIENLNYNAIQKFLKLKWFSKIFANFKHSKFIIFTNLIKLKDKLIPAVKDKSIETQQKMQLINLSDNVLTVLSSNSKFKHYLKRSINQQKFGTYNNKMTSRPVVYLNKLIEIRKSYTGIRAKRQIGADLTTFVGFCAFYFGLAVLFIGAPIVAAVFVFPWLLALFFVTGWIGVPAAKVFFENCFFGFR